MLENAILKLAEAIELHAKALLTINQPIVTEQLASPVAVENEEKSKRTRKSKKNQAEETLDELEDSEEKVEETKTEEKDEFDDELDSPSEITIDSVKEKAKGKITNPADRSKIKKMISDLGAESIADLKPQALIKLDKQLDEIK